MKPPSRYPKLVGPRKEQTYHARLGVSRFWIWIAYVQAAFWTNFWGDKLTRARSSGAFPPWADYENTILDSQQLRNLEFLISQKTLNWEAKIPHPPIFNWSLDSDEHLETTIDPTKGQLPATHQGHRLRWSLRRILPFQEADHSSLRNEIQKTWRPGGGFVFFTIGVV